MMMNIAIIFLLSFVIGYHNVDGFTPPATSRYDTLRATSWISFDQQPHTLPSFKPTTYDQRTAMSQLHVIQQDLSVIGLVAGQENYGLGIVCIGEAIWSFISAPSFSHAKVVFIPAGIAALVLFVISGPMITSGDVNSISVGLWIATATSVGLGVSYIARLVSSFSPSPKEIAAFGLLVAIAGFFSFAQNLFVDGFVSLPSFPSLPTLPSIEFPNLNDLIDSPQPEVVLPITDIPLPIESESLSTIETSQ
jgi:hypothetical protein